MGSKGEHSTKPSIWLQCLCLCSCIPILLVLHSPAKALVHHQIGKTPVDMTLFHPLKTQSPCIFEDASVPQWMSLKLKVWQWDNNSWMRLSAKMPILSSYILINYLHLHFPSHQDSDSFIQTSCRKTADHKYKSGKLAHKNKNKNKTKQKKKQPTNKTKLHDSYSEKDLWF